MAPTPGRSFLDGPSARLLAALVFVGCVAALVYVERGRLWQPAADRSAADDPFARCLVERGAEIDRMVADDLIDDAQATLFMTRAEAMCRATTSGSQTEAPSLPVGQGTRAAPSLE